jgi:hypothetical protein
MVYLIDHKMVILTNQIGQKIVHPQKLKDKKVFNF